MRLSTFLSLTYFPLTAYIKNFQNIAKLKEFCSEHLYIHHLDAIIKIFTIVVTTSCNTVSELQSCLMACEKNIIKKIRVHHLW